MDKHTAEEIERVKACGMREIPRAAFLAELDRLGYSLIESDCFNYRNTCNEIPYDARSVSYYREKDTGKRAFHVDARRDDKFRELQKIRRECFVVSRGRIWDL